MKSRVRKKRPLDRLAYDQCLVTGHHLDCERYDRICFSALTTNSRWFHHSAKREKRNSRLKSMRPVNVLLIGVDERKNDPGRADAIMLLSFNPKTKKATSLSIPRDMQVTLADGAKTKINHTYAYGGVEETIETVEQTFDVKIPYYAKINMEGLIELVDAVGGVTVDNPSAFSWNDRRLQKDYAEGEIKLDRT